MGFLSNVAKRIKRIFGSSKSIPNPYEAAAKRAIGTQYPWTGMTWPEDPKKVLTGTVNNQYWGLTRGSLDQFFNPDSIGVPVYAEMMDSDETCFSAIEFLILATLAKFGEYRHKNPEIESFVNSCLENLETPWLDVLKEQLTCVPYGYSVTEIIAEYDGEKVRPIQLQTVNPSEITLELHLSGPKKNLVRAARQNRFNVAEAYLPSEKCVIMTHNKQFGNAYGKSRLRTVWRSWFLKAKMLASWANVLDRYGSPHAVATVSGIEDELDENGETKSILPLVTEYLNKLAKDGSVAVTDAIKIDLHQAKQAVGADFQNFIDYLDKMIYRGSLVPSLVGDHGSNGSYALGSRHYDLFVLMLEELAQQLANTNLTQFIKPLVIYNYGEQDDYGGFVLEDFKQDDELLISQAFLNMVNGGYVNPNSEDDRNKMRERTGFTPQSEEEYSQIPPYAPIKPAGGGELQSSSPPPAGSAPNPSSHYKGLLRKKYSNARPGVIK